MVKKYPDPKPSRATTAPHTSEPEAANAPSAEELKAQQRLLNIFNDAFKEVLSRDDFATILQAVKGALYDRDFERAFGSEQYLEVYAARYSPPRALCYSRILGQIAGHLESLIVTSADGEGEGESKSEGRKAVVEEDEVERGRASPTVDLEEGEGGTKEDTKSSSTLRVLAVGGGAAEIVAFGDHIRSAGTTITGDLTLLDTGPWQEVVQKLHTGLTTSPVLSKFASATAKAANAALVEPAERLTSTFVQQDVLELDRERLPKLLGQTPLLITMLFTLNELYTSSGVGKTTAFLRNLTATIPVNSLLLVVDSPGSYSEASVGKEAKKYPMQWLLDHTLLQTDKLPPNSCRWEKLESHDSIWFRHDAGLKYPIKLEDIRYQMHLYRACPRPSD
ncbi:hypothetical protein F4819DRAFT_255871 [Hypoxylon fuscum]|nr:hypothetical protein F4819DRAFT_255871 [Hypoxylon fuscum]